MPLPDDALPHYKSCFLSRTPTTTDGNGIVLIHRGGGELLTRTLARTFTCYARTAWSDRSPGYIRID